MDLGALFGLVLMMLCALFFIVTIIVFGKKKIPEVLKFPFWGLKIVGYGLIVISVSHLMRHLFDMRNFLLNRVIIGLILAALFIYIGNKYSKFR